jgi:hypothetical protein
MLPTACGGSRAVLTHGARSQDIGIQAAAARLSSASARYCTSARQQGERGEQRQRKRQVVAQEPPSATVVCCVSARSNQSNAEPRAEEPRPYHEAPADWPRPLLPNPLDVLPRRAPSTSCHLQAARAVRASSYAHSAPSPICSPRSLSPLVRNLPSRRPTSPTIDTRASQLPTPHVHTLSYPHCYTNGQLAQALKSRIVPSFQTPRYVDKCTQPANTKHHVMRVYGLFIKGPNT